jgi:hypothetical protein
MVNNDFQKIIELLISDWNFLQQFIFTPEVIIPKFSLTAEQQKTLLARDVEDLIKLGFHTAIPCGI